MNLGDFVAKNLGHIQMGVEAAGISNQEAQSTPQTASHISLACRICPDSVFETVDLFRAHFKTDWHLANFRRGQRGLPPVPLEGFVPLGLEDLLSDSSEDGWSDQEAIVPKGSPFLELAFKNGRQEPFCIYRSLVARAKGPVPGADLADFLAKVQRSKWTLILIRAGRFAGIVVDNASGQVQKSRSLKRYTTRRKQGGAQFAKDNAKKGARSAGAHLRRHNEQELVKEIRGALAQWQLDIDQSQLIFWNETPFGRSAVFGGDQTVIHKDDPRLRTFPFTTYSATVEELQRCYRMLFQVYTIQMSGSPYNAMADRETPPHVFAQFFGPAGEPTGPPISVSVATTHDQLEALVNEFLKNAEPLPYALFVNETEIVNSLESDVAAKVSLESILAIKYQPQAVFRVRPISRCTSSLAGHTDAILAIAFSPDGRRLATGSGDASVRFWDLNTDTPLATGKTHKGYVLCLAWSPDGRRLASGSMDNTVQIWDGATGQPVGKPLVSHVGCITSLAWEPLHLASPTYRLVSGSKDGTAKVWDVLRCACTATLSQHTDSVSCVKWGGDGTIYTGSRDRTIRMWTSEGRMTGLLAGHGHWINTMALSTDFALRTGAFDHEGRPVGPSPQAGALQRYQEARGGDPERLVSGSDDFTMLLWCPAQSQKPIARLTGHQGLVFQASFSPDCRHIASGSADKSVKIWNGATGQFVASLRGHVGSVYQVCWSADSRLLMSASKDSTAKIWEPRTRALKLDLPGHFDEVYAIDWSPTGDRAASGGKDKLLKLYDDGSWSNSHVCIGGDNRSQLEEKAVSCSVDFFLMIDEL